MKANIFITVLLLFTLNLSCQMNYKSPGVYVEETPSVLKTISSLPTSHAIFIGHSGKGAGSKKEVSSYRDYVSNFGNAADDFYLAESVSLFFQNGGKQCFVVSVGTFDNPPSLELMMKGLKESEQLAGQIISIPDAAILSEVDFYKLQNALLSSCKKLKDRFAIINTYRGTGNLNQLMQQFRSGIKSSKYGAAYFPWLEIKNKRVPVVGAIAGIYAKTDLNSGVWKAPANVVVTGIIGLSQKVNQSEQGTMNVDPNEGKSINAIRHFTGKGNLVWGARTLAGNDNEWRYVPVRRLAILVEQSIAKGLDWVVFEPNSAELWAKVRISVENYLTELYRQGALQGTKPEDAFFVKCGLGETMTQNEIANKKLILEIGVAPLRPAEFIILQFSFKIQES